MSLSDKSYQEKRDFLRMKIQTPLGVELNHDGQHYAGLCRELSGGGMQVELSKPLAEGEELEVRVISTHGHSPQLHARARVVRAQTDGDTHLIGLEIIEVLD
ncbi:MAG TPA: PilZ domain-containing protein [Cellvibrionaceae bacterium]